MSVDFNETGKDFSQYENMTVSLTLDDDTELECEVVAVYPSHGNTYIALAPLPADEESEIYLYRFLIQDGEEPQIVNIESDEEYDIAADAFDELLDEEDFNELFEEEEES